MSKIWVLTRSHNNNNPHCRYIAGTTFVAVFKQLPTVEQLIDFVQEEVDYSDVTSLLKFLLHLQKGGGRINDEQVWFTLVNTDLH